MKLMPYFRNGSPTTDSHDALLPVRVAEDVLPNGFVVADMRNGTALQVPASALLRLDARPRMDARPALGAPNATSAFAPGTS